MEPYTPDPASVSMDQFYALYAPMLAQSEHETAGAETEAYFRKLKDSGIQTLGDLILALRSDQQIVELSSAAKIPADFLVMLRRDTKGYFCGKVPLSKFPGIPFEFVEVLKSHGISHARGFFESVQTAGQRKKISATTGIPEARLREIFSLCDLSRIPGADANFARVIYLAGIRSMDEFAESDAGMLERKISAIIEKHGYGIKPGSGDQVRLCIVKAKLMREIATGNGGAS